MGKYILKTMKIAVHYRLHLSVILAGILLTLEHYFRTYINDSEMLVFIPAVYIYAARILLGVLWVTVTTEVIALVIYRDRTGRFYLLDRMRTGRTYLELLQYYKDADPYRLDVRSYPVIKWKKSEGVILGKKEKHLIYRSAFSRGGDGANYFLVGLPGCGKTVSQIICSAMRFGGSVFAIDFKGQILEAVKDCRNVKVFAPGNPEISAHFNPLSGIMKMDATSRRVYIEQLARIIIPAEKEAYFSDSARDFFCGITYFLLASGASSLGQIADQIVRGNGIGWTTRIKQSQCSPAQSYTNAFFGTNEKNVNGAYGHLVKSIRLFSDDALMELLSDDGDCITAETLDKGWDVYVEVDQDKLGVYAPVVSMLSQWLLASFMRRPDRSTGTKNQPILMLLDEFPQLGLDCTKSLAR